MGRIIRINPSNIRPSQDFLKEDTLQFINERYLEGDLEALPPTPIVRETEPDTYIAIDGHNLLAFSYLKGLECDVYVAKSSADGLEGDTKMIQKRNQDLSEKYAEVLPVSQTLGKRGIRTIADLCEHTGVSL